MEPKHLANLLNKLAMEDTPELSVLSEEDEIYKGSLNWVIQRNEMRNKTSMHSEWFNIGSADYCKCSLQLFYEEKFNGNRCEIILDFINVKFFQKLPDGSNVKGLIAFADIDGSLLTSQTFASEENTQEIRLNSFTGASDLRQYMIDDQLFIWCSIKVNIGSIKWESENRSFFLTKNVECDSFQGSLFREENYTDVTFRVRGGEVKAHKAVLALKSPTFRILFNGAPSSVDYFKLKDIDIDTFNHMLQFVYSGDVPKLDFKLASELFVGAHNYIISDLKSICSSYFGANLTVKNVFIVMSLAHKCNDILLKEHCIEFIQKCDSESLAKESVLLTK